MDEELYGLLGLDPEKIRQQQMTQGLLSAGLQLLAGSGYSPVRRTTGELLGQAGAAGLGAYQQAGESSIDRALKQMQIKQMMERNQARKTFQDQIAAATQARPTAQSMAAQQSNIDPGMLEGMSQQDVARQALAAGLPSEQVTDEAAANRAVMNFLRTADPLEYAKMMVKEPKQLPADMQGYQLAVAQGFKGSFLDYQERLRRSGATNVSVSTEKSYGGALAGKVAEQDAAKFDAANAAPGVIQTIQATRNLLDTGNVITGIGAQQRLDLARVGQLLGVGGKDANERVANTQQLFANRAQATLDSIRSSGLGAGQGFSNKDREFLENARLGNITYDPTALRRQLDIEERVARATVTSWNNRIKKIPQDARGALGLNEVELPAAVTPTTTPGKAPPGVRQELWDVMTPEQKKLWLPQ